jgi:hypothetical protein
VSPTEVSQKQKQIPCTWTQKKKQQSEQNPSLKPLILELQEEVERYEKMKNLKLYPSAKSSASRI